MKGNQVEIPEAMNYTMYRQERAAILNPKLARNSVNILISPLLRKPAEIFLR
jgi:hypothetical protein